MDKTELLFVFSSALLLTLSFPPFPLGVLAPFGIALFLWLLRDKNTGDAFRLGYWLGLLWGAMTLFWIAVTSLTAAVLVVPLNAFHYALVFWIFAVIRRKSEPISLLILPFFWVGMEYLRNFSDIRFNWMTLAYTQSYYLHFIQIIEYTGYLFLSFVLVFAAVSLYAAVRFRRKERWLLPGFTFLLILILIVFGEYRMHQVHGMEYQIMKVGLVQPDVDPYEKWSPDFKDQAFHLLMSQSRQMTVDKPDLIVWPETATPFYLKNYPDMLGEIASFTDSSQLYLLTGTPDYEYSPDYSAGYTYNAAFFFGPGSRKFEKYYKIALVPGSESVPFKTWLPFLRNLDVGGGDFFPGGEFTVFNLRIPKRSGSFHSGAYSVSSISPPDSVSVGLSAVICYESVFPHLVRQFIKSGAAVLAVVTNDGWFGNTSGPYQHARYAVFRAVENRVAVVRCANTGISAFIDPAGRVLKQAGLNTRSNMVTWIPVQTHKTYYTRNGEWFGRLTFIASGIFIFFVLLWNLFFRT